MAMRRGYRLAIITLALAASIGGMVVAGRYSADLRAARDRLAGRSEIVELRDGQMEYAVAGRGPPLLMIHGTGGGFDQGLLFSREISSRGVQVIAPSRFGYLRSHFPPDHSSERQADAFVELLDRLRIGKVAVAGGSAGALSAVQFALRHPERTSALILIVPAANVDGHDPNAMSPAQQWVVQRLMTSDLVYWIARRTMPDALTGFLLATDPALLDRVSASERQRASQILDAILPISERWQGMLNDAELAGRPARVDFSALKIPMLIISAKDDRFGTAATAAAITRQVQGARLVIYPTGGHILLDHNQDSGREVAEFVLKHAR